MELTEMVNHEAMKLYFQYLSMNYSNSQICKSNVFFSNFILFRLSFIMKFSHRINFFSQIDFKLLLPSNHTETSEREVWSNS
jgi:hypothetical protein